MRPYDMSKEPAIGDDIYNGECSSNNEPVNTGKYQGCLPPFLDDEKQNNGSCRGYVVLFCK